MVEMVVDLSQGIMYIEPNLYLESRFCVLLVFAPMGSYGALVPLVSLVLCACSVAGAASVPGSRVLSAWGQGTVFKLQLLLLILLLLLLLLLLILLLLFRTWIPMDLETRVSKSEWNGEIPTIEPLWCWHASKLYSINKKTHAAFTEICKNVIFDEDEQIPTIHNLRGKKGSTGKPANPPRVVHQEPVLGCPHPPRIRDSLTLLINHLLHPGMILQVSHQEVEHRFLLRETSCHVATLTSSLPTIVVA